MTAADRPHITILGTRGIPGPCSGFEYFADEFSARLVERAHEIARLRQLADRRVAERYSWDRLTSRYESYFREPLSPN